MKVGPSRVLVTGGAGFVGAAFASRAPHGTELAVTWRRTEPAAGVPGLHVDLADVEATARAVGAYEPLVVVHTAYGADDLERDVVAASENVAMACARIGAALVHLSSDVVFSGDDPPYGEWDEPSPVSAYGRAKAEAESRVVAAVPDAAIVRTSLVLDPDLPDPRTAWIVDQLRNGVVELYLGEVRQPILLDDLTGALWSLLGMPRPDRAGPWHVVGPEPVSRLQLGRLVAERFGLDQANILPVPTPTLERRPRDLRLRTDRLSATGWRARPVSEAYRGP